MPRVHRTLPIPQVDPPAQAHADSEPGVGPVPAPSPQTRGMKRKPAFRTPVYVRPQSERGIDYGMNHKSEQLEVNVPLPVRSSLAQDIGIFKVQLSHYFRAIAGATRYPGMRAGYPVAKVLTLVNTAPQMRAGNPRNTTGLRGHPARSGFMNAPPRFKKALPLPTNQYVPPIYGG
jgi:hypothetical protein